MKCKFRWMAVFAALAWAISDSAARQGASTPPPAFPEKLLEGAPDFDFALMLQGDLRGNYAPCGSPSNAMGGFARRMSYWNAFAGKYPTRPSLRLDVGSIFSVGRADSAVVNRWMLEGAYRSRLDALNLSAWDVPAWQEIVALAGAGSLPREFMELPLVSANVRPRLAGFPAVRPYVIKNLSAGNGRALRVGITGLLYDPEDRVSRRDFEIEDPQIAARRVLQELQSKSNYTVFLIDADVGKATSLAVQLPAIDLIAAAHDYVELAEPHQVGNTIVVLIANEGRMLSEIRFGMGAGSEQIQVAARFVPLDRTLPDDPSMGELVKNAQAAVQDRLRPH